MESAKHTNAIDSHRAKVIANKEAELDKLVAVVGTYDTAGNKRTLARILELETDLIALGKVRFNSLAFIDGLDLKGKDCLCTVEGDNDIVAEHYFDFLMERPITNNGMREVVKVVDRECDILVVFKAEVSNG